MKFLVSTLERFRRSRGADDSAAPLASADVVAVVQVEPEVAAEGASSDFVIHRSPQQNIVTLRPCAVGDVARAQALGAQLVELLGPGSPPLLLIDLRQIGQLSSEGLNQLIRVNCHARSQGVRFVLANLCEPLREVFRITRLDRLFELTDHAESLSV